MAWARLEYADLKSGNDLAGHRAIEGVELLGSIELDCTDTVYGVEEDVVGVVLGFLLRHLRTCGQLDACQCRNSIMKA